MFKKRLFELVPNSKIYIIRNVVFQWLAMIANIIMVYLLSTIIYNVYLMKITINNTAMYVFLILLLLILRSLLLKQVVMTSYGASRDVKILLRSKIYNKMLQIGKDYTKYISTSEMVQITSEGVEQLEIYFGNYLPQLFYSFIAPFTLFVILSFVSFKTAFVLFICVPLIPISIVFVQKIAKNILKKYWGKYTQLGSSFLENLEGLTTLKIYKADGYKHEEMNEEAEVFRKVTMKVLIMQLNSITVMDIITFGGSAIGILLALSEYAKGNINMVHTIMIILLSAEFFLPMRLLGSYFHIAMNGMTVSDKMFKLLDVETEDLNETEVPKNVSIKFNKVSFSYDKEKTVLNNISFSTRSSGLFSIVGESGSGKSTIANIIMGKNTDYKGSIKIGKEELRELKRESINENITLVGNNSYIFKGTVRDNLMMGVGKHTLKVDDVDELFKSILSKTRLLEFLNTQEGLDTKLEEGGSNFSGGQKQRLALARALVANTPVYIFDEATSNIDSESEKIIIDLIKELSNRKLIILISHKLYNTKNSDKIVVLKDAHLVESGTHESLLEEGGDYNKYYTSQMRLISLGGEHV